MIGMRIRSQIGNLDFGKWAARASLSPAARLRLYRKLASLVRTGMPIPRALDAIWQPASHGGRKPEAPLARVVHAWRVKVYDGHSFGEALAGWVPSREAMIVEAGSGDLGQALEDAAGLIESSRKMTSAVLGAIAYPGFLAGLLCVLVWIFSVQAIPAFAEVKPMAQWTGLAASMGTLSVLVHGTLVPMTVLVILALAASLWSLPRWTGDWRQRCDRFPPWSFYRLVAGTSFLTSLVAFLRAGMPVPEGLRRLRAGANPWLRERIDAALYFLNSGYDLGDALHLAGHDFPDREIVDDLRIYASLGNLDDALKRLSGEWGRQSIERLQSIGDLIKLVGMILVAACIAWIQLGIIAIQQQLTSGF